MADARKDNCGNVTCTREEDHREIHSQTDKSNELGCCKGAENYDKESDVRISEDFGCSMYNIRRSSRLTSKKKGTFCSPNVLQSDKNGSKYSVESPKISFDRNNLALAREVGVGNMPQVQHKNVINGACPAENAFTSSMKPSSSVSPFEFYVRSEEGINLFVDLNSSPSDWAKRLENEVCVDQNLQKNKFQSFRQELERLGNRNKQLKTSFHWNPNFDNGMNNDHVQIGSSRVSIKRENGHVGFDQPDGGDGSLGFSAAKPCSVTGELTLHAEEDNEVPFLSRHSSDVPNKMVSCTESCPRDRETKTFDSNVLGASQVKLDYNYVVNLTSDGSESLDALEDQNSKLGNENCGNKTLQNPSSLENPAAVYSGCSAIGSIEIQLSEVASHQKSCSLSENNCWPNLGGTMHNAESGDGGLANSSEVNHDAFRNHTPACAEEWPEQEVVTSSYCVQERENPVDEMDASDPLEKRLEDSVTDGRDKRKMHDREVDDTCSQHEGRVLRSAKRLGGKVLPRRSMRLVSK